MIDVRSFRELNECNAEKLNFCGEDVDEEQNQAFEVVLKVESGEIASSVEQVDHDVTVASGSLGERVNHDLTVANGRLDEQEDHDLTVANGRLGEEADHVLTVAPSNATEKAEGKRMWRMPSEESQIWEVSGGSTGCKVAMPEARKSSGCLPAGVTSLHVAADSGNLTSLKASLAQSGDVDFVTFDGFTALHLASNLGHSEAVSILLAAGADPSRATMDGATSLHTAARRGYLEIAEKLLDVGAAVSCDHLGFSPLHDAAHAGHHEMVKLLLAHLPAKTLLPSRAGTTPLDLAAHMGHYDVVKEFLDDPSMPEVSIDETLRALQLAASGACSRSVLKLLLGHLKKQTLRRKTEE